MQVSVGNCSRDKTGGFKPSHGAQWDTWSGGEKNEALMPREIRLKRFFTVCSGNYFCYRLPPSAQLTHVTVGAQWRGLKQLLGSRVLPDHKTKDLDKLLWVSKWFLPLPHSTSYTKSAMCLEKSEIPLFDFGLGYGSLQSSLHSPTSPPTFLPKSNSHKRQNNTPWYQQPY